MVNDIAGELHSHNLDVKGREIFLHGHHGTFDDDPGVEYRMATTFIKNLRILDKESRDPILIHMHSLGGNWGDGMAMYDAISMCRSHTTMLVYGQAESMSGIVLQSVNKRIMMPNAYFMAHFGNSRNEGGFLDCQNWSKFENVILASMLDIFTKKCMKGKYFAEKYKDVTEAKVDRLLKRKMKDGDWYLTSHEAVYYGFADSVITHRKYGNIDSLK